MTDETTTILMKLMATLDAHIDSEENTLARIERALDGNGQPGLVRSHVSHSERLAVIEAWIGEWKEAVLRLAASQKATQRWLIGLVVASALTIVGIVVQGRHP